MRVFILTGSEKLREVFINIYNVLGLEVSYSPDIMKELDYLNNMIDSGRFNVMDRIVLNGNVFEDINHNSIFDDLLVSLGPNIEVLVLLSSQAIALEFNSKHRDLNVVGYAYDTVVNKQYVRNTADSFLHLRNTYKVMNDTEGDVVNLSVLEDKESPVLEVIEETVEDATENSFDELATNLFAVEDTEGGMELTPSIDTEVLNFSLSNIEPEIPEFDMPDFDIVEAIVEPEIPSFDTPEIPDFEEFESVENNVIEKEEIPVVAEEVTVFVEPVIEVVPPVVIKEPEPVIAPVVEEVVVTPIPVVVSEIPVPVAIPEIPKIIEQPVIDTPVQIQNPVVQQTIPVFDIPNFDTPPVAVVTPVMENTAINVGLGNGELQFRKLMASVDGLPVDALNEKVTDTKLEEILGSQRQLIVTGGAYSGVTSTALMLAHTAALHGIKTLLVDLSDNSGLYTKTNYLDRAPHAATRGINLLLEGKLTSLPQITYTRGLLSILGRICSIERIDIEAAINKISDVSDHKLIIYDLPFNKLASIKSNSVFLQRGVIFTVRDDAESIRNAWLSLEYGYKNNVMLRKMMLMLTYAKVKKEKASNYFHSIITESYEFTSKEAYSLHKTSVVDVIPVLTTLDRVKKLDFPNIKDKEIFNTMKNTLIKGVLQ